MLTFSYSDHMFNYYKIMVYLHEFLKILSSFDDKFFIKNK